MGTQNGIPYQGGRSCSYDFQKLFREVDPKLLGFKRKAACQGDPLERAGLTGRNAERIFKIDP
jgi:hypothetical protein